MSEGRGKLAMEVQIAPHMHSNSHLVAVSNRTNYYMKVSVEVYDSVDLAPPHDNETIDALRKQVADLSELVRKHDEQNRPKYQGASASMIWIDEMIEEE